MNVAVNEVKKKYIIACLNTLSRVHLFDLIVTVRDGAVSIERIDEDEYMIRLKHCNEIYSKEILVMDLAETLIKHGIA